MSLMKFVYSLIGLLVGALMGGVPGALIGTVVGLVLAVALNKDAAKPASKAPPAQDAEPLAGRLEALEQEIGALKTRLARLENPEASALGETATAAVATVAPAGDKATTPSNSTAADFRRAVPAVAAPQDFAWSAPTAQAVTKTAEPVAVVKAQTESESTASPTLVPWESRLPRSTPVASTPPHPAEPAPPPLPQRSLKERMPPFLRNWIFGGNTIVKVGVLILFFGLAFLLRYAAERVTVPIELRYAGVALVGALLLGVGWRLRHGQDKAGGTGFGQILQGAGIAVFYLTTLGALKLSQLMPAGLAFGLLLLVVGYFAPVPPNKKAATATDDKEALHAL